MSASHECRTSLFASSLAALLFTVGQAFQPAIPPVSAAPPATESKKAETPVTKPVQEAPPPATSGGTLIKRKKPSDQSPAPSKTAPPVDAPPTKAPHSKSAPKDDKPLKPESSPAKPAGKSEKTTDKPEKPVAPDDEALLKSLGTNKDDTEADDVERLERAIAGMRQAQQRIEERDSGKDTQEIQTRVVKDLASLIDALQNPKSPPQDQDQDQNPQNQDQQKQKNKKQKSGKKPRKLSLMSRRQMAQMRQQQQEQQRQREQARRNQEDQPPSDKSKDTSASQAATKAPAANKDRQQELVKDVWGHLPPNVRAELLNVFSEKYLPKYEDLVRRYYEALAEKNRGRTPGR